MEQIDRYMSEDEIVNDIISKMTDEQKEEWMGAEKEDLIGAHFWTGKAIRNYYKLWEAENPYTVIDAEPNKDGIIYHPDFPDQVSQRIIEKVWRIMKYGDGDPKGYNFIDMLPKY